MKTLLLFLLVTTGCSVFQRAPEPEIDVSEEINKGTDDVYHPSPEFGTIQLEVNPAVQKWLNYFQERGRAHMERYLKRSTRYISVMKAELRKRGMPEELIYVPLIESGFNHRAYSYASAVGYWQFIRGTAKRYGLRINTFIDERRDPILSTNAAAEYFSELYNLFGDWYLALAAYNAGENRIKRAVMKYKTRNFWRLAKGRRLPRETRNYVPKFIAAALIHQNPAKYGFHDLDYQKPLSFDEIRVARSISLYTLAKNLNLSYKELKKLNPKYRSDFVPVRNGRIETVRVPMGYGAQAIAALSKSYASKPLTKWSPGYFYYRIRRGDTLSGLAVRFRTSVRRLRSLNGMGRRSFLRAGRKIKIPESARWAYLQKRQKRKRRYSFRRPSSRRLSVSSNVHVVRRGENLSTIARRYGISLSLLRKLNGLNRRSLIRVGQVLVIRPSKSRIHVVRRGENLSTIARRYGTTVRDIAKVNALRNRSRIMAGRRLIIPIKVSSN